MADQNSEDKKDGLSLEAYRNAFECLRIGNAAVHKAQEENRRLGIPNWYSINGIIFSDQEIKALARKRNRPWNRLIRFLKEKVKMTKGSLGLHEQLKQQVLSDPEARQEYENFKTELDSKLLAKAKNKVNGGKSS